MILCLWLLAASPCAVALNEPEAPRALQQAQSMLDNGEYRAAAITLKNFLREQPENSQARYWLGRAEVASGDMKAAVKEFERALELGEPRGKILPELGRIYWWLGDNQKILESIRPTPDDSAELSFSISLLHGDAHAGLRQLDQAEAAYRRAMALSPKNSQPYLGLATLALQQHPLEEAAGDLVRTALQLDPDSSEAWIMSGFEALSRRDHRSALKAFDEALRLTPKHLKAQLGRAMSLNALNRPGEALEQLNQAQNTNPDHVFLHLQKMETLAALKQYRAAYEGLQLIHRHAEKLPKINLLAGFTALQLGHHHQAEQHLRQFLDSHPGHDEAYKLLAATQRQVAPDEHVPLLDLLPTGDEPNYYALLGDAYLKQGDLEKSRQALERAAELDPGGGHVYASLGKLNLREGALTEGIKELEKAIALGDERVDTETTLIEALIAQQDIKQAQARLDALEASHDSRVVVAQLQSRLWLAQEQPQKAREALQRAVEHEPDSLPLLLQMAYLELQEGEASKAQAIYQRVLELNPEQPLALSGLALINEAEGHAERAHALWRQALRLQPDNILLAAQLVASLVRTQEYEQALVALGEAPLKNHHSTTLLQLRAEAELQSGDYPALIETLEKLSQARPDDLQIPFMQGKIYLLISRPDLAAERFNKVLNDGPRDPKVLMELAKAELTQDNMEQVQRLLQELEAQHPATPYAAALKGRVAYFEGDFHQAAQHYEEAYEISGLAPFKASTFQSQLRAGQGPRTREAMKTWLVEHPDDRAVSDLLVNSLLWRARAMEHANMADQAIDAYQRIFQWAPDNLAALGRLSILYHQKNRAEALVYARRAYHKAPEKPEAEALYGWLLFEYGDKAQGLDILRKALVKAPDQPGLRLQLATALERAGKQKEAHNALQPLLGLPSDSPLKLEAEKLNRRLASQ
nr:XrtA/PEP-CTERM system TPR-repeat protein PrsT [Motiliproteus sp. SC1-56]